MSEDEEKSQRGKRTSPLFHRSFHRSFPAQVPSECPDSPRSPLIPPLIALAFPLGYGLFL